MRAVLSFCGCFYPGQRKWALQRESCVVNADIVVVVVVLIFLFYLVGDHTARCWHGKPRNSPEQRFCFDPLHDLNHSNPLFYGLGNYKTYVVAPSVNAFGDI